MSLKLAVLALLAERRGYGYDLAQRFEARLGPAWQLNPSAVYPALDQLERAGLVSATVRQRGRRTPRVLYTPTPRGAEAVTDWLRARDDRPEPVRSDLHLRLAFSRPGDQPALYAQVAARERACAALLARATAHDGAAGEASALVRAGVAARLGAELAWLRDVRRALASDDG
jgi:DNA-binding PadR family transcriptional regulator